MTIKFDKGTGHYAATIQGRGWFILLMVAPRIWVLRGAVGIQRARAWGVGFGPFRVCVCGPAKVAK